MNRLMVVALVLMLGCASKFNEAQLIGQWAGVKWKDVTNDKIIDAQVSFSFEQDGRYEAHSGASTEKGKYWISGDNLHTIEDGKAEKKVKIAKLQKDTLVFRMNRAGTIEEIILVKGR